LIIAMRAAMNEVLPKGYLAAADRYVWIHEPDAENRTRIVEPDGFIVKRNGDGGVGSASITAPATVVLPAVQREGNKYLKILDAKTRRVITVIELLSPTNKRPGPDRDAYLAKRLDYLAAGVNVVEIDLLRGGERMPLGDPFPEKADYYMMVCRANELPQAGVWWFSVRDPIPVIPVPLSPGEGDVSLDLRACLDRAYAEGRYRDEIDYTQPPEPPLSPDDGAWARQLLSA
jgi:hypothetical protein